MNKFEISKNYQILTSVIKSAPYLFATLGKILTVSFKATVVPYLENSSGYSYLEISKLNGSILCLKIAFAIPARARSVMI